MAVLIFGKERVNVTAGVTIQEAVLSSGKLPDTYLYLITGKPVPMTSRIGETDEIEAIRIASGG